jgi:putative heme iron utilization protein
MDDESRAALGELLRSRRTAALGTLHDGEPAVSMVPFGVAADGASFLIHVSGLAQHTRDMRRDGRVSLMMVEDESAPTSPLALARVSIRAIAVEIIRDSGEYVSGRSAYLGRHPDAEELFGFGDFALFELRPVDARFVGGFARAFHVSAEELAAALREG